MEALRSLLDFFAQRPQPFRGDLSPIFDIRKVAFPQEIQTDIFQDVGDFLEDLSCLIGFQRGKDVSAVIGITVGVTSRSDLTAVWSQSRRRFPATPRDPLFLMESLEQESVPGIPLRPLAVAGLATDTPARGTDGVDHLVDDHSDLPLEVHIVSRDPVQKFFALFA